MRMLWWQQGGGSEKTGVDSGGGLADRPSLQKKVGSTKEHRGGAGQEGQLFTFLRGTYFGPPLAASTVLWSSIARVSGPTPPGTGVIAAAFSRTAS